jgi:ATP-dependent RNA helicase DeaD
VEPDALVEVTDELAAPEATTAIVLEADETDEAIAESEDAAVEDVARPRRRGRRGGRGRSRGGAQAATPEAGDEDTVEPEAEADLLDDEFEIPAVPAATTRATVLPRPPTTAAGDFPPAFVALGIDVRNLEAITRLRYEEPTPIQERAIPALLNGLDVVGVAQTGSGKTVAFGVPMMERLDASLDEVQAIVLVPTRELAQQVLEVLDDLGKPWGLEAIGLLGGRRLEADFRALKERPHVVVGTPGRIIDHLNRGTLSLRHVRCAVLDEADQMLDIGFLPDIRRILSRTPKRRQTALFSATMPGSIRRLVWQFMDDPETVTVDPELSTVDTIEQTYLEVAQRDKVRGLRELIERELKGRTLVFSRTKRGVDHLEAQLSRDGVRVGALHGDMDQRRRDRVVQDFREGKLDILIATNVAARGLDIPEITHVVNYDVPQNVEEYVHRIGRTGRAGRSGKAITFVCEWDMQEFDVILREFGEQVQKEELHLYTPGT